ncbi:hypothetical protein ILUMI_24168 [Ignelater luminosus]|uniref:Major facilitator superfamily (MFS) profile domain-containing protein n=1 Tax=Ignelater luminosus TaxID=2038154 RepID=A0A8K0C6T2_IGNLU|nr:hypothetical protein ILUMI_24168 [Ignelater luminosus]
MDTISSKCCSNNINEKATSDEHRLEEPLISHKSLDYYEKKNFKTLLPQIVATIIASSFQIAVGSSLAYSAILIPQLMEAQKNGDEDAVAITKPQTAWIASCVPLIGPVGAIIGGFVMDSMGRLNMLRLTVIPSALGWGLIAVSTNFPLLLTGRLLTGIAAVWGTSPGIVYITEISRVDMRGSFVLSISAVMSLGMAISYLKGWFMHWRVVAWLCTGYSVIPVILLLFIPESPLWLVSKGKIKEAKASLEWFHKYQPQNDQMPVTYAEMKLAGLQKEHALKCDKNQATNTFQKLKVLLQPVGYKPLIIISGLFFFQQFGGVFVVMFYAVTFFKSVGTNINPYFVSSLIGLMRLVMSIVNIWMMKKYNRRSLYFVSSIGMVVSLGVSGLFTKWIHEGATEHNWVPMCMLVLYVLSLMIGVLPIPFAVTAEMFPLVIRGIGNSLVFCIANLLMFASLQSYYTLESVFGGSHGLQYFYAISLFGGLVFSFVFLPETFNKKLSDIEDYFWHHTTYLSVKPDEKVKEHLVMKNVKVEQTETITEKNLKI